MLLSPAPDSCVLLLVRHGATAANLAVPHVLQGCGLDLSLCDVGARQAEQVAQFLSAYPCDAIFSSGLKRAVETAERIAAKQDCRLSLETITGLHEVDVGRWESRDWDEIQLNDIEAHRLFMEDPAMHGYPEGETIADVAQRVTPIFEALGQQHLGKRIIVVAHNIVLRAYLAALLGIPLSQYRRITQDNCCVNVLVWSGGAMTVRTVNAVFHLGKG
jgi:uncharacterized phosphatase